jgi:hypothetical protein
VSTSKNLGHDLSLLSGSSQDKFTRDPGFFLLTHLGCSSRGLIVWIWVSAEPIHPEMKAFRAHQISGYRIHIFHFYTRGAHSPEPLVSSVFDCQLQLEVTKVASTPGVGNEDMPRATPGDFSFTFGDQVSAWRRSRFPGVTLGALRPEL